jgi:hypothetical protein
MFARGLESPSHHPQWPNRDFRGSGRAQRPNLGFREAESQSQRMYENDTDSVLSVVDSAQNPCKRWRNKEKTDRPEGRDLDGGNGWAHQGGLLHEFLLRFFRQLDADRAAPPLTWKSDGGAAGAIGGLP